MSHLALAALWRLGSLVRRLHDATAEYSPPHWATWEVVLTPDHGEGWVCHDDLAVSPALGRGPRRALGGQLPTTSSATPTPGGRALR